MTDEPKNEIAVQEQNKEIAVDASPSVGNFLSVISDAAKDPNVDVQKMHGLLDIQERMMNKQAEIDFNVAMCDLQADLPTITMDAKIVHKGKLISKYATYEHIDKFVRPLLIKYGFAAPRFTSNQNGNNFVIEATLSHRSGHSEKASINLTIDTSGAKNNVQGMGSTISYGKRYLVGMLLNLVFEGEDDDGQTADHVPITDEQAAELKAQIERLDRAGKPVNVVGFLEYVNAKSVDEISASNYNKAKIALDRRENAP